MYTLYKWIKCNIFKINIFFDMGKTIRKLKKFQHFLMLCIYIFMNILPKDVVTFLLGNGKSTARRKAVSEHMGI